MQLTCLTLGHTSGVFEVDVDAGDRINAVKARVLDRAFALSPACAPHLELFLACDDSGWIGEDDEEWEPLSTSAVPPRVESMVATSLNGILYVASYFPEAPPAGALHLLVRAPRISLKRKNNGGADTLFDTTARAKSSSGAEQGEQAVENFDVVTFPSMANPAPMFPRVVIRASYKTIFDGLTKITRDRHAHGEPQNVWVTGSPGVGLSRLFLYVIWRITATDSDAFQSLILVLNFEGNYCRFDPGKLAFVHLTSEKVEELKATPRVLRLIDTCSSDLTDWAGVSVLFASPAACGRRHSFEDTAVHFILPPWSMAELRACNALLSDRKRITPTLLAERYEHFGGNPRFVFAPIEQVWTCEGAINRVIDAAWYDELNTVRLVHPQAALDAPEKFHWVLTMVPDESDLMASFHVAFASRTIAKRVVENASRTALPHLDRLTLGHRPNPSMPFAAETVESVTPEFYHALICHRWFELHLSCKLEIVPLPSGWSEYISMHAFTTVDVSALSEVSLDGRRHAVFYRVTANTALPLHAIVVEPSGTWYCLQFTTRVGNGGVEQATIDAVGQALGVDLTERRVRWVFVVPYTVRKELAAEPMTLITSHAVMQFSCVLDFAMKKKKM